MAAREEGEEHPHQGMVTIRPEDGDAPCHDEEIDDQGKENQYDAEYAGITPPAHGSSPFMRDRC